MAKYSLGFAAAGVLVLVAMAAVAEASTKTILTTTTVDDATNPTGKKVEGDCRQQTIDRQILSHCQMYITTSIASRSRGPGPIVNPAQEHLQYCCTQLLSMDKECVCEGIKMMMKQQQRIQQTMGGEMMDMAMNLPKRCRIIDEQCQMEPSGFKHGY